MSAPTPKLAEPAPPALENLSAETARLTTELHALGDKLVALRVLADDTIAALRVRAAAPDLVIPTPPPVIRRLMAAAASSGGGEERR